MSRARPISFDQLLRRAYWLALGVLLLTSVHHAYGAYVYGTPWRLHVVFVSVLTAAALAVSLQVHRRRSALAAGRIAFWTFSAIGFVIPVILIGLYEGGYNHVAKDVLYFGGAPRELMRRLFPPPAYELPDNLFFEITGVQQLVLGVVTGDQFSRLVRKWGQA